MPITRIEKRGNELVVLLDDGTRVNCYRVGSGVYYARANTVGGDGEPPVDPPDPGTSSFKWPFPLSAITGGLGGTNDFGSNYGGPSTGRPSHTGIDFGVGPAQSGTPNRSAADGVVSQAYINENSPFGGGREVQVEHVVNGVTYTLFYSHGQAGSVAVNVGDVVTQGQTLSLLGSTGNSTGPHLHFGVMQGFVGGVANWINPSTFMASVNPENQVV